MKKIFLLATMLALGATFARADIYTEFVDIAPTTAGSVGQLTFAIPQFNSALGTLNSVGLTLTPVVGAGDIGYTANNLDSSPVGTFISISYPSGSLIDTASLGLDALWSNSQTNYVEPTLNPGLNTGVMPGLTTFSITPSSVTTGPSGFVGSGNYDLTVNGAATAVQDYITDFGEGGPVTYDWYADVGGDLQIDYNYTAVPEPSGVALAGLGGLLLFCWKPGLRMSRLPSRRAR